MHRGASERAPHVVTAVGPARRTAYAGRGGGSGAYFDRLCPATSLAAEILDLPAVLPIAQKHIDRARLSDRVKTRPGTCAPTFRAAATTWSSFRHLSYCLAPRKPGLFRRGFQALYRRKTGGTGLHPGGRRDGPPTGALFSLNMLVNTEKGASYSEQEYAAWLRGAGSARSGAYLSRSTGFDGRNPPWSLTRS